MGTSKTRRHASRRLPTWRTLGDQRLFPNNHSHTAEVTKSLARVVDTTFSSGNSTLCTNDRQTAQLFDNKNEGAGAEQSMPLPPGWQQKVSKSKGVCLFGAIVSVPVCPQLLSSVQRNNRATGLIIWHAAGQSLLLQHKDWGEHVDTSADVCC